MPFLDRGDLRLHYRFDDLESDSAPVLVLSNSLGTDLSMWTAQLPAFGQHFRVLRYDARGHGASAVTPGPYTVERLGRDVLALLDALELRRVHFCGLSLGGMVGMWLAIEHGERLDRLVLCNTGAKIGTAETWNTRIATVRASGMAAITGAVLERWFTPAFRERAPQTVAPVRDMLLRTSPEGYIACCAAVRDMDQRDLVKMIRVPTLVIAGAADQATPVADGRFLAEQIPQARYREFAAAHLSNIEAAADFTHEVVGFLTR